MHRDGQRGETCPGSVERDRSPGIESMGREHHYQREPRRSQHPSLPRQLYQNRVGSRFFARDDRALGGARRSLGWESRGVAVARSGGHRRSRSRSKEDCRERSPRSQARGSHPSRKESGRAKEHENRVPLLRRNPLGFKAQCAENPQSKKEQETWEEEEKIQGAEASQELQQQQLQRGLSMQQREQWGEHRFGRLRSPLQRGTQSKAVGKETSRYPNPTRHRRDEPLVGAAFGGRGQQYYQAGSSSIHPVACDGEECTPSSEEGVADFGLYNGSSSSAGFPGGYGLDHAEGQGYRDGARGSELGRGAESRAGPFGARDDHKCRGGPGRSQRVSPRSEGSAGHGERKRKVAGGLENQKGGWKEEGWEVPQGGRKNQPNNTSRPDQTELIDLEALSLDSVRVAECPAPSTGKSGEAPALDGRHPGSEIDADSCYSEDWVLGIVDLLLGRCSDCGLGSLVSSFCKGREAAMAEGNHVRASIFPLPLPSKQDFAQSIEKRDRRRVWFFLVLVALNYLNGGVHSCLASFEPSEVQSGVLSYLEERVDTFLEHNFSLERFDWSNFLRTRTVK